MELFDFFPIILLTIYYRIPLIYLFTIFFSKGIVDKTVVYVALNFDNKNTIFLKERRLKRNRGSILL
jgi:hypothetical protein